MGGKWTYTVHVEGADTEAIERLLTLVEELERQRQGLREAAKANGAAQEAS
jgi:hypothetical protein